MDIVEEAANKPDYETGPLLELSTVTTTGARAMTQLGGFFNPEAQADTDRVAQLRREEPEGPVEPDHPAGRETEVDSATVPIDHRHAAGRVSGMRQAMTYR